jgi:hypothetical protein
MKKNIAFVLLYSIFLQFSYMQTAKAQVSQKGIVYELSSGNKPIAGVEIIAEHASIGNTDNDGRFSITFQEKQGGEPVFVSQVYKNGYELVNSDDVKDWLFSPSKVFKVVMCRQGFLAEAKRMYYKIGEDYYKKEYQKTSIELKKQLELNQISEKQYQVAISDANEQLVNKRKQLDYYADKFSRINKDELTDLDEQALNLLNEGKIEDAIKVYEDAKILEKFLTKLQIRDTANYNIAAVAPLLLNQADLLIQKSGIAEQNHFFGTEKHCLPLNRMNKKH